MAKDNFSGNRGEWSEPYVLLKLLGGGKLFTADENLKATQNHFPILKIFRDKTTYAINGKVQVFVNEKLVKEIEQKQFTEQANFLFGKIVTGGDRAFRVTETENFLKDICCDKIKASSQAKIDISMQLQDNKANDPVCGFSIKSEIGGMPTLVNASGATNFVYEVKGLTDEQIKEINAIESKTKIIDRMKRIDELSADTQFADLNKEFMNNLTMIDSRMAEILAYALYHSYSKNIISCVDIVKLLEQHDFLKIKVDNFYSHKFKEFLCNTALGMTPAHKWSGIDDANGGYIIVTKKGDVLAYHIFNRDSFKNYLLKNTKFERASTTRHGYAKLYKENGKTFIKLSMQVRFI